MLIIALGTVGSGSTWCFNVIRALLAESCPNAVGLSAAEATTLLRNVPRGTQTVVVKTHHVDTEMLTLAVLFHAKIIITTRDPRDSLVSQRERFGASLHEAVSDLTRSAATLSMLETHLSTVSGVGATLRFRYEDRFMDDRATIAQIASFLNVPIDTTKIERIFEQMSPERVARKVDRLSSQDKLKPKGYDEEGHWHPGHLGDGESGKWKQRLEDDDQEAVMGAVGCDLLHSEPASLIEWSAKLFSYFDERTGAAKEVLDCEGEERGLIWGPYQHLRTGRWQVTPRLQIEDSQQPVSIKVDIFIPVAGRDVLALRVINLPAPTPERLVMEFDHHDHLEPVELRVSSIADRRSGQIRFSGVELRWLGPSERPHRLTARPVSDS